MYKHAIVAACLLSSSAFAVELPQYSRTEHPICSCSCEGRLIFKNPAINDTTLKNWSQEALQVSFDYGFGNYKTALENASQYFTRSGWDNFIDELMKSKNLDIMLANKLVAKATITTPAKINKEIHVNNLNGWEVEMNILAEYSNSHQTITKPLRVTLEIVKTQPADHIASLAIQQLIIEPID